MNEYIRLEYKDCFSERPDEILHYLNGISKEVLLKLCSLFLSRGEETVEGFFSSYFNAENNEYINEIWRKLYQEKSDINRYIITNIESTLRLYEFVFDNITYTEITLSEAEIEINEGSDRLMTKEEIEAYLQNNNRTLTKRIWIPDNTRATGLFVADMAIDLRALFCVTTNQHEPELSPEMITALEAEGWVKSKNVFGECLVMPKAEREKIIPVLANALINWRITSNQARTFSLMETLALAVSDNANHIAGAIRTKLIEEGDKPKAKLIIDETAGAEVFVTLPCASYVVTVNERATALEEAEKKLTDMMMAFDYENQ